MAHASRPWSASSPLKRPVPSPHHLPDPEAITSPPRSISAAAEYIVTPAVAFVDRRTIIRTWSAVELRDRLANRRFFAHTIVHMPPLATTSSGASRPPVVPIGGPTPLVDALFHHRVDGAGFLDLTQDDLARYIGVRQLGTLKAILREIRSVVEDLTTADQGDSILTAIGETSVDVDPYVEGWQRVSHSIADQQRPQSAGGGLQKAASKDGGGGARRPLSAAAASTRIALDPFVYEQRRFVPDIIRCTDGGDGDEALGIANDGSATPSSHGSWAAGSTSRGGRPSSAKRIHQLLASSREKRAAVSAASRAAGGNASSRRDAPLSAAVDLARRLESAASSGGVAACAPWQHDRLVAINGMALPPASSSATTTSDNAAPTAAAKSAADKGAPHHLAAAPVSSPQSSAESTTGIQPVTGDADAGGEFVPGIMERERRYSVFAAAYLELAEGLEAGVTLGFTIDGLGDALAWDETLRRLKMHSSYTTVRNNRAMRRRRKQLRSANGTGEAATVSQAPGDSETALQAAATTVSVAYSPDSEWSKFAALKLDVEEFRDVMTELCMGLTPTALDKVLRSLSDAFGDGQRERVRRVRDVESITVLWDVARSGVVPVQEVEAVVADFNSNVSVTTLRLGLSWSDDVTPIYVGSSNEALAAFASQRDAPAPGPDEPVRLSDVGAFISAAWGASVPAELFDEAMLAMRGAVERATRERLGLGTSAATADEVSEQIRTRLSRDRPVLITYSTVVSPSVSLLVAARAASKSLLRFNVGSRQSEDAAMEAILSHGATGGAWIAIDFPRHAAAVDPLHIPPTLATLVEEEPAHASCRASPAQNRSRAASVSSYSSAVTATSAGALDPYTGERFTGSMVAFLRRVALGIASISFYKRHDEFRLFVHAPIDFASPVEIPSVIGPLSFLMPLLGVRVAAPADATSADGRDVLTPPRRVIAPQHLDTPGRVSSRLQRALEASRVTQQVPASDSPSAFDGTPTPVARSVPQYDVDALLEATPGREKRFATALVAAVLDFS